jgi:hypothetical protein
MFLFLFIPYYLTAVYPLPNAGCKKLYYSTNINDPVSKTVGEASLPEKPRLFDIILKCSNVPISICMITAPGVPNAYLRVWCTNHSLMTNQGGGRVSI